MSVSTVGNRHAVWRAAKRWRSIHMPDVTEQLRSYGDAIERQLIAVLPAPELVPVKPTRKRIAVIAALAAALIVVLVLIVTGIPDVHSLTMGPRITPRTTRLLACSPPRPTRSCCS